MLSMELLKKPPPAWGRPPLPIGLKDAAEISEETLKSPPSPPINAFNGTIEENPPPLEEDHRYQLVWRICWDFSRNFKIPPLPANQCFQWNYSRNRPLFGKTTATNWFEGCCCDLSRNFKIPPSPPINAFNGTTQETAPYLGRPPLPIGLKDAAAISQETLKPPPPRQSTLSMELLKKNTCLRKTTATNWFEGCCWDFWRNFKTPPPRQSMLSMELLKKPAPIWEDHRYELVWRMLLRSLANQCFQWNYWRKNPLLQEDHRYELVWRMLLRSLKKL